MMPSACPEHGKLPSGSTGSCPDCAWRPGAQTTAPFDGDGRPDKFHTFSGARDAAETPNPPRVSRMQRLAQLRGMTDGPT